jgi:hypothetical protein
MASRQEQVRLSVSRPLTDLFIVLQQRRHLAKSIRHMAVFSQRSNSSALEPRSDNSHHTVFGAILLHWKIRTKRSAQQQTSQPGKMA